MASSSGDRSIIELVYEGLRGLGLEPSLIPPGRMDELRGGVSSVELRGGRGIDAAVLMARWQYGSFRSEEGKSLFRVDYAVRGSIKGVLPGRILARTSAKRRGLLRREVTDTVWETPLERRGDLEPYPPGEALPPGPGELWDGCPHEALVESLNGDGELMESVRSIIGERRGSLTMTVFTDRWGESIRIGGSLWLEAQALPTLYLGEAYVKAVSRIGERIKEVRRGFGGLTF